MRLAAKTEMPRRKAPDSKAAARLRLHLEIHERRRIRFIENADLSVNVASPKRFGERLPGAAMPARIIALHSTMNG